jgi:hypothetical protein
MSSLKQVSIYESLQDFDSFSVPSTQHVMEVEYIEEHMKISEDPTTGIIVVYLSRE